MRKRGWTKVIILILLWMILPVTALCAQRETEPNDHITQAQTIVPGQEIQGSLQETDVDYYRFSAESDCTLQIVCASDAAGLRFSLRSEENECLSQSQYAGFCDGHFRHVLDQPLPAGHYVLAFACEDEALTQYSFSLELIIDHSHTYETEVIFPTCVEGGFTRHTCSCGHSYTSNETAPVGHIFGPWTSEGRYCVGCDLWEQVPEDPFTDVVPGQYFYEPVLWAYENAITKGRQEDRFAPEESCTRAQIVTFLWRAMGCPEPKNIHNPFADINPDAYYGKAVLWAVEQGITQGKTPTTFVPDAPCTRAQAVTFLWRALKKPAATETATFSDVYATAYYAPAVSWAVEQGVTLGKTETSFAPDLACTRGQIVTFLFRALGDA